MLTLKVLGFATHKDTRATMRSEAVAFAAGVVLTFVALGVALAVLRAAGAQLGWGFQLQSPAVVSALAILFFVLALNLSGVFEFGQLAPVRRHQAGRRRTARSTPSAPGILAVVIALAVHSAVHGRARSAYALAASATTMLAIFVALGIGMALPYVLLAWFPGWRRRLPRPGPWLERFKQVLAFPLYATVIWLAWVLGAQRDNDALLRLADRAARRRLRALGVADRAHRRRAAMGVSRARRCSRFRRSSRGRCSRTDADVRRRRPRERQRRERRRATGFRSRRQPFRRSTHRAGPCSSTSRRRGA